MSDGANDQSDQDAPDDQTSGPLSIVVQPAAADDLRRQAAHFQEEAGGEVARRFLYAARASLDALAAMPGMGASVESRIIPDLRRWRVKGFEKVLIFYRFDASAVYVIRVLHGMRDLDSILSDTWELNPY